MALAPNCCACSHMRSKASVRACSQRISVDGDVAAEQGLQRTEDVADDRARTNRDSAHHAKTFLDVMAGQIERARNHGFQHVPSWMDVGSISARRPGHSAFVPESLTTFAHFVLCAPRNEENSLGVPPAGSTPWLLNVCLISGSRRMPFNSALSFTMKACGVPAGATTPNHTDTSKPGTPDSATVGRSWTKGERCLLDTASARNLPAFTCCSTFGTLSNIRSTWPPIRSVTAGALPLYGT